MTTYTPSNLIKPGLDEPANVLPINDNSARIDLYGLGAYVVQTDTFPLNPWEGMKVYKALYQELYVYSTLGGAVAGQWWLIGAGRKIAYTPVINGVTLGTGGSVQGQYFRVGHNSLPTAVEIHFRIRLTLGTGGDVTSFPEIGLPGVPEMWTAGGADLMRVVGHALAATSTNPGSAGIPGIMVCTASTAVGSGGETQQICRISPDSTLSGSLWTTTVPFDWAANSTIWIQGHYWADQNGVSWGV